MKILIAYYSKTGHTKKVALDLAEKIGADTEEVIDKKNRFGFFNWFLSGRDGMRKKGTEITEMTRNPAEYDLIIFGSPVWGWNMVPAARTYLEKNKAKIKKYAFFVTSGNTDSEKLVNFFQEIIDQDCISHVSFNAKELKAREIYEQKMEDFANVLKNNF